MIFEPQIYKIPDIKGEPFIDAQEIQELLDCTQQPSKEQIEEIIAESKKYTRLSLKQTATLLAASNIPEYRDMILNAAKTLKEEIYGNRIVLFAPLYIGNRCTNRCTYCSFRADNKLTLRKTLSNEELIHEVENLERVGHKRLILVYGEHPLYNAEYIAQTVQTTYGVRTGNGQIRRVNINAAPLTVEGFRTVKDAGIGTYQIFQETYHPQTYKHYHLGGQKADYNWRLTAFDRAMEAGIDDVGLGALLGLHEWKFEIMGLIRHTNHLEACFGVGPHTISFPRINEALGADSVEKPVSDDDFIFAIAVLRLAVPYVGLILTARESEEIRNKAIEYGVSQIDGGSKLDIGGYSVENTQEPENSSSQFSLHDNRTLGEIMDKLMDDKYIPSFCTACYTKGRTGEHFLQLSTKGFIKRFCTPNALLTFAEYVEDYAKDAQTKQKAWIIIDEAVVRDVPEANQAMVKERLEKIKAGERNILF